ncbi:MAG: PfkB family carbohydrate kinase [Gaiella sp.]
MARLAVIGTLSVDRVDGGPPTPGGCPTFAAAVVGASGGDDLLVARCAERDRPLFDPVLTTPGLTVRVLAARESSAFRIEYGGDERSMWVEAVGDGWTPDEVAAIGREVAWAHVAPLFRTHFPAVTLAALAAAGCRVSLDGQGLVRVAQTGPLTLDSDFDPSLLEHVQALKLSEEEAAIVAPDGLDDEAVERLGAPEILLTLGSRGSVVHWQGERRHVPARAVTGVQATGAGDAFMVGYARARLDGAEPFAAAAAAGDVVTRMLEARKDG